MHPRAVPRSRRAADTPHLLPCAAPPLSLAQRILNTGNKQTLPKAPKYQVTRNSKGLKADNKESILLSESTCQQEALSHVTKQKKQILTHGIPSNFTSLKHK